MSRRLAALAGLLLTGFVVVTLVVVHGGRLVAHDLAFGETVHVWAHDHPWAATVAQLFTFLGNGTTLVPLVAVVAVLLWRLPPDREPPGRLLAGYLIVTVTGGVALSWTVKHLVQRSRPAFEDPLAHASGYSFPSGHAMAGVYAWGTFAVLAWLVVVPRHRRAGLALMAGCVAVVPLIGLSRVLLGVHWPIDVVAGWLLAGAWLLLTTGVLVERLRRRRAGPTPSSARSPAPAPPG